MFEECAAVAINQWLIIEMLHEIQGGAKTSRIKLGGRSDIRDNDARRFVAAFSSVTAAVGAQTIVLTESLAFRLFFWRTMVKLERHARVCAVRSVLLVVSRKMLQKDWYQTGKDTNPFIQLQLSKYLIMNVRWSRTQKRFSELFSFFEDQKESECSSEISGESYNTQRDKTRIIRGRNKRKGGRAKPDENWLSERDINRAILIFSLESRLLQFSESRTI